MGLRAYRFSRLGISKISAIPPSDVIVAPAIPGVPCNNASNGLITTSSWPISASTTNPTCCVPICTTTTCPFSLSIFLGPRISHSPRKNKGIALEHLEQLADAIAVYENILELDPTIEWAEEQRNDLLLPVELVKTETQSKYLIHVTVVVTSSDGTLVSVYQNIASDFSNLFLYFKTNVGGGFRLEL